MFFLSLLIAIAASYVAAVPTLGSAIPGNSPARFCSDPRDNALEINRFDLTPDPPVPGQPLLFHFEANATQSIEQGAYATIEVKLGYIVLLRRTLDLCESMMAYDLACPIEKGPFTITKTIDMPKELPPGKFKITARAFTVHDEQLECFQGELTFRRA